ncbi:DUF2471 family protein [Pandoraea fibrosis]|uniref:DUF2471 family protein n=1 Tax=Pandoraea fibrosis TaxID=1891094 RepID=A0ABX6HPQ3_9BURK|nr:DUF2471 family protein [Pandoraea fibrosis]QHE93547.1 DUF2471 family protein [Pandoraea fibrosis]QHF12891.1 DUF2471 family protein [Pandoraea fibrosis]
METIDWDQLALSAAERDLAGIVREIAARYAQQRLGMTEAVSPHVANASDEAGEPDDAAPAPTLDWRTLVAIADEAEADIGLHARHEPWVLARLLRLPGDEALRRNGELPPLDAPVDLHWPDAAAPAVFRAIVAAVDAIRNGDDPHSDDASSFVADPSALPIAARRPGSNGPACTA